MAAGLASQESTFTLTYHQILADAQLLALATVHYTMWCLGITSLCYCIRPRRYIGVVLATKITAGCPENLKRAIVHILTTRALSSWLSLWLLVNTALPIWSTLMCESLPVSVLELICSCIRPYKMEICVLILVEMQRSTTTTTARACLAKSILIYSSRANTSNL